MPRWKIKLQGQDPFYKQADHIAYEGPAVILYNEFPYQPVYVLINWNAQIIEAPDSDA